MRAAISSALLWRLLKATPEQYAAVERILGLAGEPGLVGIESVQIIGRFHYRAGFEDVWLGTQHYDLRLRPKARLCLAYLVQKRAFTKATARHLREEIDPYICAQGPCPKLQDVRLDDYFKDRTGKLGELRRALIRAGGGEGKYYLAT
jgi:hypothetical protein